QRPVLRLDVDAVDEARSGRDDDGGAALGLAGQHGGAAAAGLREPVDGVDRRSRVRYDHLREARPERRRHRALEILRHTKHARQRVGMQPLAEGALLVLQAPPAAVEVVAPLAERLRQVAQPGLFGEGVEERVLALLDGLLEWRARPRERLDARLGLGARRLALRLLRAQPIDLRPERRRGLCELRETGRDPLALAAALDRPRRELPAALGEAMRPCLGPGG